MAADRSAGNTLKTVLNCRDLAAPGTVGQELPSRDVRATEGVAGDGPRRLAAFAAGIASTAAGVAGLHHLYRGGGGFGDWTLWSAMLLLWLSALGGGIKLAMWATKPIIDAGFQAAKQQLSEAVQATVAALAMIAGALGMWWVLRGGFATWWHSISGEPGWSLMLATGQMLVAVLAGAALFTGGKHLSGLAGQVLADAGIFGTKDTGTHHHSSQSHSESWHPALMAALIAGGAGLVVMTAWLTPKLAPAIMGANVLPAIAAIAAVLVWAVGSNLGWWKGLAGLYVWATDASQKAGAVAGVAAVLMFSASGLGLGWFTPATVPQAHAACPPDCGGGGGLDGPPGGGQMFQPPSQGGQQMPDYQSGMNQSPMDQNGSISIYNTQAPSISNNGANGSTGQQSPQQGWDQPAHGTQPPDYQNATPYTQGPGRPNPDYNPGGQSNPGSQGGQANQGGQSGNQGAQQPQQPPSQNSGQQPPQNQPPQNNTGQQPDQQSPNQSDQQRLDELTRQLQDQQQQSGQDRQRIDDLTKQLQQQGQQKQNGNQKLPKAPSKDKKQDDQQDRDKQSGDNDTSALLLGAASTRRRKQDDQQQPEQGQQQQGPDTQALAQDGAQLGQSLPGDIANTVSDSVNLGQSAGSAAQNFGSAAQAGASLASSAQSGAVNPMDAVALVQGVSGGISDTADAVGSGASIASTWINNAGQGAQLAADANPQLQPQAEQFQQLTQAGGQVADLTGQVAGGVSQVSGLVNTASSLGTSGMPDTSGVSDLAGSAPDVSQVKPVEFQSGPVPRDVPKPPPAPSPPSSSPVQAMDSTTTRAPQQPHQPANPAAPKTNQDANFYKDWYPKQPPQDPTAGSLTGSLNKMGITEPKSPVSTAPPTPDPHTTPATKLDANSPQGQAAIDTMRQYLQATEPPDQVESKLADAVKGAQQDRPMIPAEVPKPTPGLVDGLKNQGKAIGEHMLDMTGLNGPDRQVDAVKSSLDELQQQAMLQNNPGLMMADGARQSINEAVTDYQHPEQIPNRTGQHLADGAAIVATAPLGGEGALGRLGLRGGAAGERAEITHGLPEPRELPAPPATGGSTYKQRLDQTPVNNGQWTDQRGESTWLSENPMVNQFLNEAGVDGIEYSNARPDFGPVAQGQVEIPGMTTNRRMNFKAADEALAQQRGVTRKEVTDWREANNYTWHEEPNLTTMQLVPSIVNNRLGHLGGIGELNAGKTLPPIGDS